MKPHVDVPDTEMRAAESREETVERVAGGPPHSQRIAADPSSRRHVGVRLSAAAIAVAVATAVLVLMVVLLASGGVGLALGLAGAAALGAGVIAALVVAEREDGRIEREVGDGGGGPDEV
jgi:hypothetical protein